MTQIELQTKATQAIWDNKKCILNLSPRSGKTKITIDALKKLEGNTLISVPSEFMIDIWKQEMIKWGFNDPDIVFCCHASLNKQDVHLFDNLILDEVHSCISDIRLEGIKQINANRIIGLSGSMSQKAIDILKETLGLEIKMKYSVDMAVENNVIKDYIIYIHKVELLPDELKEYNRLTSSVNWCKENGRGKQLMFSSLKRARFLYNLKSKNEFAKKLINNFDRYIVFCQLTTVADNICSYSFHSKGLGNTLELFKEEKINNLAVVKLANEGETFPNLDTAVIIAVNSSEISMIQRVLRTMSKEESNNLANIHVIISKLTIEESWLEKALGSFDKSKIIIK